jgi:hypothetical protein
MYSLRRVDLLLYSPRSMCTPVQFKVHVYTCTVLGPGVLMYSPRSRCTPVQYKVQVYSCAVQGLGVLLYSTRSRCTPVQSEVQKYSCTIQFLVLRHALLLLPRVARILDSTLTSVTRCVHLLLHLA